MDTGRTHPETSSTDANFATPAPGVGEDGQKQSSASVVTAPGPNDTQAASVSSVTSLPKAPDAHCENCVYKDRPVVYGYGPDKAKVVMVGEAPGKNEVEEGRPFIGRSGKLLDNILEQVGVNREEAYVTNAVICHPPDNETPKTAAIAACRDRLVRELRSREPETIVALGATAAKSILKTGEGITSLRTQPDLTGGPGLEGIRVVATLHPAAALRVQEHIPSIVRDLSRIPQVQVGWEPTRYTVQDDIESASVALGEQAAHPRLVLDIERDYDKAEPNTRDPKFLCIGISHKPGHAVVYTKRVVDDPIWQERLREQLARPDLDWGFQRGQFDIQYLWSFAPEARVDTDTQLLHLSTDERVGTHDLEQMAVEILRAPRYKTDTRKWLPHKGASLKHLPPEILYEYNASDADVTHRLIEPLTKEMISDGTEWVYRNLLIPGTNTLARVESHGVRLDTAGLRALAEQFEADLGRMEAELRTWVGNPRSPKQVKEALEATGFYHDIESTNKLVLQSIAGDSMSVAQDFAKGMLEYRGAHKLLTTYIRGLTRRAIGDRVYGSFSLNTTETGRLCVSPDTLIEMPRDLGKHPNGIPITELKAGDLVYSFNWKRDLCLRRVKWAGPTQFKRGLKVTIRDEITGERSSFTASRDHLVRLYRGDWRPCGVLKVGDRLLCMVRRAISDEGYAYFFPHSRARGNGQHGGGKSREHRWIYAQTQGLDRLPVKWDVHHADHNKLNNSVDNLEFHLHPAHIKMHKPKTPPEAVQAMLDGAPLTVHPGTLKRLAREYDLKGTNHTIIDIEEVPMMRMWDLEVEDTHTFIGNGVALHNSSSNPNLQNIPRDSKIRGMFIAPESQVLLEVDYAAIEMRLMAEFADDDYMLRAFSEGRNLHRERELRIWGTQKEEPYYTWSKNVGFGSLYLGGADYLASLYGIDPQVVRQLQADMHKFSPSIKRYWRQIRQQIIDDGYLRSYFGRLRRFWLVTRENLKDIHKEGVNFMIQSPASDLTLMSLIKLEPMLRGVARPVITVHDSLVFECPTEAVPEVAATIRSVMEDSPFNVPTPVEFKVGPRWGLGKEYDERQKIERLEKADGPAAATAGPRIRR